MKNIAFILLCLALLSSCKNNTQQIPLVGDMDSTAIASDTLTQKNIEANYEFSRSLSVHQKLVYDIVGYGGPPSSGMYAIIRRGADNKPDTIAKGNRTGIIENVWLTNLDKKNRNELILVTRSTDSTAAGHLIVYAIDNKDVVTPIQYTSFLGDMMQANYHGKDSFYVEGSKIAREFPLYADGDANCCPSGGIIKISYTLTGTELKEGKMDMKIGNK